MAKYGNILAVFTNDIPARTSVENILTTNNVAFIPCSNLYFLQTTSMPNTGTIITQLKGLGVEFLFFHQHIPTGSQIKTNGLDPDLLTRINKIMF